MQQTLVVQHRPRHRPHHVQPIADRVFGRHRQGRRVQDMRGIQESPHAVRRRPVHRCCAGAVIHRQTKMSRLKIKGGQRMVFRGFSGTQRGISTRGRDMKPAIQGMGPHVNVHAV